MRYKAKEGDHRIVKKFLLVPKTLGLLTRWKERDTRWWETVKILQVVDNDYDWRDIEFIDLNSDELSDLAKQYIERIKNR